MFFTGLQGKLLEQLPSGEHPSLPSSLPETKNHCIKFLFVKRRTQKKNVVHSTYRPDMYEFLEVSGGPAGPLHGQYYYYCPYGASIHPSIHRAKLFFKMDGMPIRL
jgi:hypothetical protein